MPHIPFNARKTADRLLMDVEDTAKTTADVDNIFDKLKARLTPHQYGHVMDAVENFMEAEERERLEDFRLDGDKISATDIEQRPQQSESLKSLQVKAQIFLHIKKEKGWQANSLILDFTAAVAKLTDAEYNNKDQLVKIRRQWTKGVAQSVGFNSL